jgi:salicylate hydroxylase
MTQHGDRVEVQFHNGATTDADVVVGADGIHSTVREAILGLESPRFSGHVTYRGLVPAARVADLGIELVASSWWGPNHHFVHYFVGAGARYLNWVAVTPGEMAHRIVDRQRRGGRCAQGIRGMASPGPRDYRLG